MNTLSVEWPGIGTIPNSYFLTNQHCEPNPFIIGSIDAFYEIVKRGNNFGMVPFGLGENSTQGQIRLGEVQISVKNCNNKNE